MSAMALASPPDSDIGRSPPGSRPPGMPKVNSNTENLLRGSFEAYGDGGGAAGGGRMGSSGWQTFCTDCKFAEGSLTMQRLDMIFGGHATPGPGGRALSYEHFLMALAQVSEEKYGIADSLSRLVYFKIVRYAKTPTLGAAPQQQGTASSNAGVGSGRTIEATSISSSSSSSSVGASKRFGLLNVSPRTPNTAQATTAQVPHTPILATPSPRVAPPQAATPAQPPSPGRASSSTPKNTVKSSPSTLMATPAMPTIPSSTSPEAPLSPGEETELRALHAQLSSGSESLRSVSALLVGAYEHYRDSQGGMLLRSFVQMCTDLGMMPSRLSHDQARHHFSQCAPSSTGEALAVVDYAAMIKTLRACAQSAYGGGGEDALELLVARMCSPPSVPSYFSAAADARGWMTTDFSVRGGGRVGKDRDDMDLETSLAQLAAEHTKQVENLVAMSSEKEIELTVQRAKAQEELEAECAMRMAEVSSKLPTFVSRLRPSQTVLSIRAQIQAMGAMRNPIDPMLKRRLEKELATQQALDEKAHMHKAKQQHANLVRSVQEQCDKARARLSAETDRVMAELTKDMEGQFEMLRLRFEAKQNHLHQVHKVRVLGVSAQELPPPSNTKTSPPPDLRFSDGDGRREGDDARRIAAVPVLKLPTQSALSQPAARKSRGAKKASERVKSVMRQAFDCVFEPFVAMDADGDDHVTRLDLKRMMARMSVVDVAVDQVLSEGKLTADGRLDWMSFSQQFRWHPLGSNLDMKVLYAAIKQDRARCLDKFERWRTGRPLTASSAPAPPPGAGRSTGRPSTGALESPSVVRGGSGRTSRTGGDVEDESMMMMMMGVNASSESLLGNSRVSTASSSKKQTSRGTGGVAGGGTPQPWVSDAVRKAQMEKLEREKRRLAIKLLEAERKLSQQAEAPTPKQKQQQRNGSNFPSKRSVEKKPAFVGVRGTYFERGGEVSRGEWVNRQGGLDARGVGVMGTATTTGLWAVPSTGSGKKKLEEGEGQRRRGEGEEGEWSMEEEEEEEEEEARRVQDQQEGGVDVDIDAEMLLQKFNLGVNYSKSMSDKTATPSPKGKQGTSPKKGNVAGSRRASDQSAGEGGGIQQVAAKQDEWLESCIELISGLVDKHRNPRPASRPAGSEPHAAGEGTSLGEPAPEAAEIRVLEPVAASGGPEGVHELRGSSFDAGKPQPARFGLVLDEAVSVWSADVKKGVAHDVANATGVHPSKVRVGSANEAKRTLYITILPDALTALPPSDTLSEVIRQADNPHSALMAGEYTRHTEAVTDAAGSLSRSTSLVSRNMEDAAVSASEDEDAEGLASAEDEWHTPRDTPWSPSKAAVSPNRAGGAAVGAGLSLSTIQSDEEADFANANMSHQSPSAPSPSEKVLAPSLSEDVLTISPSPSPSPPPPRGGASPGSSGLLAAAPSESPSPSLTSSTTSSLSSSQVTVGDAPASEARAESADREKTPAVLDSSPRWDISPAAASGTVLTSSSLGGVGGASKQGGSSRSQAASSPGKQEIAATGSSQGGGGTSWFRRQLLAESSDDDDDDGGEESSRKPPSWSALASSIKVTQSADHRDEPHSKTATREHISGEDDSSDSDDEADYAFNKAVSNRRQR